MECYLELSNLFFPILQQCHFRVDFIIEKNLLLPLLLEQDFLLIFIGLLSNAVDCY